VYAFGARPVNFPGGGLDSGQAWADQAYREVAVATRWHTIPRLAPALRQDHSHIRMADLRISGVSE